VRAPALRKRGTPAHRLRGRRRAITIACVAGGLYLLLTLLVMGHLTDTLDATVRQWFRPDDVWGSVQLRADVIVEGFKPVRVALLLPIAAVASGLVRRSWQPPMVALQIGLSTIVLLLVTKLLVARPDPHGDVVTFGGSFPSGHTAVLLVVLGGCLIVVTRADPWWAWTAVVLVDVLMAVCLLLQAAHWFTDIIGGMLLATCLLAAARATRWPASRTSVRSGPG